MLATAIAGGGTLDPGGAGGRPWLRRQWEELGSLASGRLLPRPETQVGSLLDGDYFSSRLRDVLGVLSASSDDKEADGSPVVGRQRLRRRHLPRRGVPCERVASRRVHACRREFGAGQEPGAARVGRRPDRADRRRRDRQRAVRACTGRDRPASGRRPVRALCALPGALARRIGSARTGQAGRAGTSARADRCRAGDVRYPQEADFRGDIEDLERLLGEADSAWSDAQVLFNRCARDRDEAMRVQQAATLLIPA
ncbi:hypothetical protein GCM10027569_00890 [Flindersiella endophytica]